MARGLDPLRPEGDPFVFRRRRANRGLRSGVFGRFFDTPELSRERGRAFDWLGGAFDIGTREFQGALSPEALDQLRANLTRGQQRGFEGAMRNLTRADPFAAARRRPFLQAGLGAGVANTLAQVQLGEAQREAAWRAGEFDRRMGLLGAAQSAESLANARLFEAERMLHKALAINEKLDRLGGIAINYDNLRAVYKCTRCADGERILLVSVGADEVEIDVMRDEMLEFSRAATIAPSAP
ncbi:hypothetical protein LCGC14_2745610, partial [marine sediment metagenome]